jgi:hypothetical protein
VIVHIGRYRAPRYQVLYGPIRVELSEPAVSYYKADPVYRRSTIWSVTPFC